MRRAPPHHHMTKHNDARIAQRSTAARLATRVSHNNVSNNDARGGGIMIASINRASITRKNNRHQ